MHELGGFTYATSLDLNMGYYTIRLDSDESRICTIIFSMGQILLLFGRGAQSTTPGITFNSRVLFVLQHFISLTPICVQAGIKNYRSV